jgi:hypothetical protein
MTPERIREIAHEQGYMIIDSPIWSVLAKQFMEAVCKEIEQEQANGTKKTIQD